VIAAARRARVGFSVVVAPTQPENRAIDAIPDQAWVPVRYPGAVNYQDTGEWISDAEVAEVAYTAFAGTPQAGWCGRHTAISTTTPVVMSCRSWSRTRPRTGCG